ncbi:hypothetical protein I3843_03G256500 [Carya illinoinensis]|nr:hypothetical protein I3843_03G256500 [Carya illinoinensis]
MFHFILVVSPLFWMGSSSLTNPFLCRETRSIPLGTFQTWRRKMFLLMFVKCNRPKECIKIFQGIKLISWKHLNIVKYVL